jgi:hypothetical protein
MITSYHAREGNQDIVSLEGGQAADELTSKVVVNGADTKNGEEASATMPDDLTALYTRHGDREIEAASAMLPSLKPAAVDPEDELEVLKATGTDPGTGDFTALEDAYGCKSNGLKVNSSPEQVTHNPQVRRSSRLPGNSDSTRQISAGSVEPLLF